MKLLSIDSLQKQSGMIVAKLLEESPKDAAGGGEANAEKFGSLCEGFH